MVERRGCDSCKHGDFACKEVRCLHPDRPKEQQTVVRWYKGCPQHQPKESK